MELRSCLEEAGCNVEIVDIEDDLSPKLIYLDKRIKVHAVVTFQGLASNIKLKATGRLLWDELKINLICLHGDHPSLHPVNHVTDSAYVTHVYPFPTFARYANSMLRRNYPAISFRLPFGFRVLEPAPILDGDYFVLPKNLDPLVNTYQGWRSHLPDLVSEKLIDAAQAIIENYKMGDPLEHHEIVDLFISGDDLSQIALVLPAEHAQNIRNLVHGELDKIYRNIASELVISELQDIPLRIYGRGWDQFKGKRSSYHQFYDFSKVGNGDLQFTSNYGIIDIAPNKFSYHDRMLRAIAHQGCFLANCGAYFDADTRNSYFEIFYTGTSGDLRKKAENVLRDPLGHRDRCTQFGREFRKAETFSDFLKFIYLRCLPNQEKSCSSDRL